MFSISKAFWKQCSYYVYILLFCYTLLIVVAIIGSIGFDIGAGVLFAALALGLSAERHEWKQWAAITGRKYQW